MLLATGTEELAHIEMLATAVALNLEGATELQEAAAQDGAVNAALGGMNVRHYLSAGLAATPENCNGVPFDMSHIYASGNIHRSARRPRRAAARRAVHARHVDRRQGPLALPLPPGGLACVSLRSDRCQAVRRPWQGRTWATLCG